MFAITLFSLFVLFLITTYVGKLTVIFFGLSFNFNDHPWIVSIAVIVTLWSLTCSAVDHFRERQTAQIDFQRISEELKSIEKYKPPRIRSGEPIM